MKDLAGKLHLSEPNFKKGKWWTPYLNFAPEIRKDITPPKQVYFDEVLLREANQHPRVALKQDEMVYIAEMLDEAGVARIEFYPLVSEDDKEAMKQLAKQGLRADLSALCRARKSDVDYAVDAGATHIMIEAVANPYRFKAMWNQDEDAYIDMLVESALHAKKRGMKVSVMPYDTYRPFYEYQDFFEKLYKSLAKDGKADGLVTSDTYGMSLPQAVMFVIRKVREWCPGVPVEMHGHNDYGLGTSVMLSAVMAGAEYVHTAVNGIGERTGNAPTEEVAMVLEALLGVKTGINTEKLSFISKTVEELTKIRMPSNKAVVGDALFTYCSGLVVDALGKMKDREPARELAVWPFHHKVVGRQKYSIILAKGTGRANVEYKLKELGLKVPEADIEKIVEAVKKEAIVRKWELSDEVFVNAVEKVLAEKKASKTRRGSKA